MTNPSPMKVSLLSDSPRETNQYLTLLTPSPPKRKRKRKRKSKRRGGKGRMRRRKHSS